MSLRHFKVAVQIDISAEEAVVLRDYILERDGKKTGEIGHLLSAELQPVVETLVARATMALDRKEPS